jgi:osmotically-inducible protein OsmY
MSIGTLIKGGLLGAAIAYLFDPISGNGRRARLRDQTGALARRGRDRADKLSRHAGNVLEGTKHEILGTGSEDRPMDDATIADRVRSEVLGRPGLGARSLLVDVENGVAHLRGEMEDPARIEEIVDLTGTIPGVRRVENLVHVPRSAASNKEASRAVGRGSSA